MKTMVEHIEALRYKLWMFGIPIEGPTNVFCDNEAGFKSTLILDSMLKKKHTSRCYHWAREAVAACTMRVAKEGTATNLADLFTKPLTDSRRAIFIGQVYILTGVGFYPTSRFPTSSHHGSCWIGAGRQVKVSRLAQHGISLRVPKEI